MNNAYRLRAFAVASAFVFLCAPAHAQTAATAAAPGALVLKPPVTDLTGPWLFADGTGPRGAVLFLKQNGTLLTGELRIPGILPIPFAGAVEGAQMDIMALSTAQGGELVHFRCNYQDGRLVGRTTSIHSSPAKWHYDADRAQEFVRAP